MVQSQATLTEASYYFTQVLQTNYRTVSQASSRSFYCPFFFRFIQLWSYHSIPYKLRYLQRAKQITGVFPTSNAPTSNPDIMLGDNKTMAWNEEYFWWCQWRWVIDLLASRNVRLFHSTDVGRGLKLNESQCSKWKPSNAFHSHFTTGNRVYLSHYMFKYQLWKNANFSYYAAKVGQSINNVTLWCTKDFLSNDTVNRQVMVW
jgi:hypothetical protein